MYSVFSSVCLWAVTAIDEIAVVSYSFLSAVVSEGVGTVVIVSVSLVGEVMKGRD